MPSVADTGALGCLIGRAVSMDPQGGIPYLAGVAPPAGALRETWLKALGAAMAASGSVGLFHLEDVTPEARELKRAAEAAAAAGRRHVIARLDEAHAVLRTGDDPLSVVALGCPHASLADLARIVELLKGRKARVPLWVFAAEAVRDQAEAAGLGAALATCGATLLSDTCIVVAPLKDLGIRNLATDSAKAAFYLPSHHGVGVFFGSTEQNVEPAVRERREQVGVGGSAGLRLGLANFAPGFSAAERGVLWSVFMSLLGVS